MFACFPNSQNVERLFVRAILLLAVFIVFINPAKAATINFSGSDSYDLGLVTPGQNGTITGLVSNAGIGNLGSFSAASSLFPANTQITFKYSLASGNDVSILGALGVSAPFAGCFFCSFNHATVAVGNLSFRPGLTSGAQNIPGFLASGEVGSITLVNLSEGLGYSFPDGSPGGFSFALLEIPNGDSVIATYEVSSVPLPAAFPLLGMGIFLLCGHAHLKKLRPLRSFQTRGQFRARSIRNIAALVFAYLLLSVSSASAATIHWTLQNFAEVGNPTNGLVGYLNMPEDWNLGPVSYDISLAYLIKPPIIDPNLPAHYNWSSANTAPYVSIERELPPNPGAPPHVYSYALGVFDPYDVSPPNLLLASGPTTFLPDGTTSTLPFTASICDRSGSCTDFSGSLATTPIPNSLLLFGSGLAMLIVWGCLLRKRQAIRLPE